MTKNLKLTLLIAAGLVALTAAVFAVNNKVAQQNSGAGPVRADSHRLTSAADGKVTVVEFLDFECPSCAATYPAVKQMLAKYDGKITFVVRYFPIDSHPNAGLAAKVAQAAANQGQFAQMYAKLFEGQAQWANKGAPQTEIFTGYARALGLDLDRFARDVADPVTLARVEQDRADGLGAGVSGTPTFFVNGKKMASFQAVTAAIDKELAS